MPIFIDQTGRSVEVIANPKRIISLVPSQSEFLWDLGVKRELAGITKFCIHPDEMFRSVERVGGTKSLNLEKIRLLNPDLIIGNKEENDRTQIEELQKEYPVWMSDIYTLADSVNMMNAIGTLVGRKAEAEKITVAVEKAISTVADTFNKERVLYFIWKNPYMVAAQDTFIDDLLSVIGLKNCASYTKRYPEISLERIKELKPDFCFLSTEPYPFKDKDVRELEEALPGVKIMLVDGELFSWYGSRLRGMPAYIDNLKSRINK